MKPNKPDRLELLFKESEELGMHMFDNDVYEHATIKQHEAQLRESTTHDAYRNGNRLNEINNLIEAIQRIFRQRHIIPDANIAIHKLIRKLRDARQRPY